MADPLSANQALSQVAAELSASASTPILDTDGTLVTLRTAVGRVFTKITEVLKLTSRPESPTAPDDLYGHLLSLRAEHLITQAILTDLAASMGRDVTTLRSQAIASFQ